MLYNHRHGVEFRLYGLVKAISRLRHLLQVNLNLNFLSFQLLNKSKNWVNYLEKEHTTCEPSY